MVPPQWAANKQVQQSGSGLTTTNQNQIREPLTSPVQTVGGNGGNPNGGTHGGGGTTGGGTVGSGGGSPIGAGGGTLGGRTGGTGSGPHGSGGPSKPQPEGPGLQ